MKKMNLSIVFYNVRRALYAMMVIILAVSIPVLSWVELSHTEPEAGKPTEISKNNTIAKQSVSTVAFSKQS